MIFGDLTSWYLVTLYESPQDKIRLFTHLFSHISFLQEWYQKMSPKIMKTHKLNVIKNHHFLITKYNQKRF